MQDKKAGKNTFYYFLTVSHLSVNDGGVYYARLADSAQSIKLYFRLMVQGHCKLLFLILQGHCKLPVTYSHALSYNGHLDHNHLTLLFLILVSVLFSITDFKINFNK